MSIARLILLNGPPGIGKSTLARRYHADHALTLVVDFDELRTLISGWDRHEEAAKLAAAVGHSMARAHLLGGHDVVIAAFSVRSSFFAKVDDVVHEASAELHEIILRAEDSSVIERFRRRRTERAAQGIPDVAADIPSEELPGVIRWASDELSRVAQTRRHARYLIADGSLDATYKQLGDILTFGH